MKKKIIFIVLMFIFIIQIYSYEIFEFEDNQKIGFGKSKKINENLLFVVNGPLVHRDGKPVGGYVDNKFKKKNWIDPKIGGGNFATDNGILGLSKDGKMFLIEYTKNKNLPSIQWAIQNGPLLVKNGINRRKRASKKSKYTRSGIGYKDDGKLIVIVSLELINLYDFAELFIKNNCKNAIYLDGGPYCGYADKTGEYGFLQNSIKLQFYK